MDAAERRGSELRGTTGLLRVSCWPAGLVEIRLQRAVRRVAPRLNCGNSLGKRGTRVGRCCMTRSRGATGTVKGGEEGEQRGRRERRSAHDLTAEMLARIL